jgi:two-component system, chemotaxis family, protein-glutamate methylesterase/glutaminase
MSIATKRDIIVVGASAGGVQALLELCRLLPANLPAVVGIVIHRSPWYRIDVGSLYGHRASIKVREGRSGDALTPGTVYFAPSDHHMLFGPLGIELSRGPRVHFVRPAVDMLFASAAAAFRQRVAGVLLTGGGSDGAHGLVTIKGQGGLSIVQRPSEAADPTMPLTGIREDSVDYVASLEELPSLLMALASGAPVIRDGRNETELIRGTRKGGGRDRGCRQEDCNVSQSQQ